MGVMLEAFGYIFASIEVGLDELLGFVYDLHSG
jgi:hypothetical protein